MKTLLKVGVVILILAFLVFAPYYTGKLIWLMADLPSDTILETYGMGFLVLCGLGALIFLINDVSQYPVLLDIV